MAGSRVDKELIENMLATPGWGIINAWVSEQIENSKSRLLTVDPTDVKKIVEYQMTIRNYDRLLSKINSYANKKQEE